MAKKKTPQEVDVIGARAKAGDYVGWVAMVDQRLGLARIKPMNEGWSILVPLWKFPIAETLNAKVAFTVGNGGVISVQLLGEK